LSGNSASGSGGSSEGSASAPHFSGLVPDSDSLPFAPILGAMKKPREVIRPRWAIYALKKKAERYGSVEARTEQEAIEAAIKEYDVPERERWRISVRREA
jgi:hypothetical protein